jgi:two-component system, LytTR family, response regulator LytT
MMKLFLIEDEPGALERLETLLKEIDPAIQISGTADSVESALEWLQKNKQPDLIISDVQLADGTCFDLFAQFKPLCPVIFSTAYNQYAIDAFKVKALDYLLKPLKKEDLAKALEKARENSGIPVSNIDYSRLAQAILEEESKYNKRYLIRYGEQIRTVQSEEIAYSYTTHKAVFITLFSGKEYPIDKTLDALEKELDPKKFFRINRQFIVNFKSIGNMHTVSKSRVQLELTPQFKGDDVIVSTEKSPVFKEWLGGQ